MPYANSIEVANGIGNKTIFDSAGSDITTTVITDAIARSDSRVQLETGYTAWISTDDFYASVQESSENFAISYILKKYFDQKDEAMFHYQLALDICNSLSTSSSASVITLTRKYRSFPLEPTADIYRSIPAGLSDDSTTLGG